MEYLVFTTEYFVFILNALFLVPGSGDNGDGAILDNQENIY